MGLFFLFELASRFRFQILRQEAINCMVINYDINVSFSLLQINDINQGLFFLKAHFLRGGVVIPERGLIFSYLSREPRNKP